MPVVVANGERFTFPEGTTFDQINEAVDGHFSKVDPVDAAMRLGGATEADLTPTPVEKPVQPVQPTTRLLDRGGLTEQQQEDATVAGDVAVTLGKSVLLSPVGQVKGLAKGFTEEFQAGRLGTPEGARNIQRITEEETAKLIGAPKTERGAEIIGSIGEVAGQFAPLAGLTPQLQALGTVTRQALKQAPGLPGGKKIKASKADLKVLDAIGDQPSRQIEVNMMKGIERRQASPLDAKKVKMAASQGIDHGQAAAFLGSDKLDKKVLAHSVNEAKALSTSEIFDFSKDPTRGTGNTLRVRYNIIRNLNKQAGKELEPVANRVLKGEQVDISGVKSEFIDNLEPLDISLNDKGVLLFGERAPIGKSRQLVKRAWDLIDSTEGDAYSLHQAKKAIDDAVIFGKSSEGLSGSTETFVKGLRNNIDSVLDDSFLEYNAVNTKYADTVKSLGKFRDAAGRNFHPDEAISDQVLGLLSKQMEKPSVKGVTLRDAVDDLTRTGGKYNLKFKGDIDTQVAFGKKLDEIMNIKYKTLGDELTRIAPLEVSRGSRGDWRAAVADVIARTVRRSVGKSDEKALKALERLVQEPGGTK